VNLYLLAGVKTAPLFMERFRLALHRQLTEAGHSVHSRLLYPYGDWSRSALVQVREIAHDMRLGYSRMAKSIGGARARKEIDSERRESAAGSSREPLLLVGHSGGGTAAVHAAVGLKEEWKGPICIVLIGSPKSRIPPELAADTFYLYAEGTLRGRRRLDPITRLGTFGGWGLAEMPAWPRWDRSRHGPGQVDSVPIIGGHADYFRESEAYVNEAGLTNLQLTMGKVWAWLQTRLPGSGSFAAD